MQPHRRHQARRAQHRRTRSPPRARCAIARQPSPRRASSPRRSAAQPSTKAATARPSASSSARADRSRLHVVAERLVQQVSTITGRLNARRCSCLRRSGQLLSTGSMYRYASCACCSSGPGIVELHVAPQRRRHLDHLRPLRIGRRATAAACARTPPRSRACACAEVSSSSGLPWSSSSSLARRRPTCPSPRASLRRAGARLLELALAERHQELGRDVDALAAAQRLHQPIAPEREVAVRARQKIARQPAGEVVERARRVARGAAQLVEQLGIGHALHRLRQRLGDERPWPIAPARSRAAPPAPGVARSRLRRASSSRRAQSSTAAR